MRALALVVALAATASAGPPRTRTRPRRAASSPARGHGSRAVAAASDRTLPGAPARAEGGVAGDRGSCTGCRAERGVSGVTWSDAARASRALAAQLATTPQLTGAHARVVVGDARGPSPVVGRRAQPLTPEEETAKEIEKLLHGPLRHGVTAIFVADARTGEPLFAVNGDDRLNPASNVKMISTAAAMELLGPSFRYTTRVLGPTPDAGGAIHGNVYLLGTWDPTLTAGDFGDLAAQLAARGVRELDGDVVVGGDPTRDGIYRASVPVRIAAGAPGQPATASVPDGYDLVALEVTAKTTRSRRSHLTFAAHEAPDAAGHAQLVLAIGGTIGKNAVLSYDLPTNAHTGLAVDALRAALAARHIAVHGNLRVEELGDFIGDAAHAGYLPQELARHESQTLADIIAHVNKWSINWLADRVIMTAAALTRREPPSMEGALAVMYAWLGRHPHLDRGDLLLDSGSGLSYRTEVSPHELVSVLRSAAGFAADSNPEVARAWLASLSIAGTDGTLRSRFRGPDVRGHIHGKTGSLSTVIALSGVLDIDPARPIVFSIITNDDRPLPHRATRRAHELVVAALCRYLEETAKDRPAAAAAPVAAPLPAATVTPEQAAALGAALTDEGDDDAAGSAGSAAPAPVAAPLAPAAGSAAPATAHP
jgi:D-alanyl-D-alanine carboxypeptidase/D-alanyl-D-alanine-endopeptidase (penicillin-binding protein 4)